MSVVQTETEQPVAPPKAVVLELRDFSFHGSSENSVRITDINLIVREGELIFIQVDPRLKSREFVSVIQGLKPATHGKVLFQDCDWEGNDHDRHFRMRSKIGRVYEGHAWVANLNVAENVTLPGLHHGVSIEDDVKYWAKRFGLAQLSNKRPAFVEPSQLQIHQWIRAFLCKPSLLVLEQPMHYASSTMFPVLAEAIDEVRQAGCAVLWITNNPDFPEHSFDPSATYLRAESENLVAFGKGMNDE